MSPLPPDPYKILGVSRDAQISQIRSAHRKLVLKCHPDKIQDPLLKAQKQDEFQKVQQAYELLSDELERRKYDERFKLEELRKQVQNKANISSPRSTARYPGHDDARGTEFRASPFKVNTHSPSAKYEYRRYTEEDVRGPRIYEAVPRTTRRETDHLEKPSKRETERERERERDREREREERERERERARERDRDREREYKHDRLREKDRDRRKRQDDAAKRTDKEARRADKRAREKLLAKEVKRETEEKKRYAKPYIEPYDEPTPAKSERKRSSASTSKRHDEKRDRSSGREDTHSDVPSHPPTPQRSYSSRFDFAASYIKASKFNGGTAPGLKRSATMYNVETVQPPVPTPPPIPTPFPVPEDDSARRSSAKPRRGSEEVPRLSRERSYRASSRETLDEVPVVNLSPSTHHSAQFPRSASHGIPTTPSSPPRTDLPRTKTMPIEPTSYPRPPVNLSRAHTFNVPEATDYPRGRGRSRMHSQIEVESDSDDVYERRKDRKHRSSRRHHSPEPIRTADHSFYPGDGIRGRLRSGFIRRPEPEVDPYAYYAHHHPNDVRPSMPTRQTSYSASAATAKYPKVKLSKAYGYEDVQYSDYPKPSCEEFVGFA